MKRRAPVPSGPNLPGRAVGCNKIPARRFARAGVRSCRVISDPVLSDHGASPRRVRERLLPDSFGHTHAGVRARRATRINFPNVFYTDARKRLQFPAGYNLQTTRTNPSPRTAPVGAPRWQLAPALARLRPSPHRIAAWLRTVNPTHDFYPDRRSR